MTPRPPVPRASGGCIAAVASVSGAGILLVVAMLALAIQRRRCV